MRWFMKKSYTILEMIDDKFDIEEHFANVNKEDSYTEEDNVQAAAECLLKHIKDEFSTDIDLIRRRNIRSIEDINGALKGEFRYEFMTYEEQLSRGIIDTIPTFVTEDKVEDVKEETVIERTPEEEEEYMIKLEEFREDLYRWGDFHMKVVERFNYLLSKEDKELVDKYNRAKDIDTSILVGSYVKIYN